MYTGSLKEVLIESKKNKIKKENMDKENPYDEFHFDSTEQIINNASKEEAMNLKRHRTSYGDDNKLKRKSKKSVEKLVNDNQKRIDDSYRNLKWGK